MAAPEWEGKASGDSDQPGEYGNLHGRQAMNDEVKQGEAIAAAATAQQTAQRVKEGEQGTAAVS